MMKTKKEFPWLLKPLAWVELAGDRVRLPVIWIGCLHDQPCRLLVGLREGVSIPGAESFCGDFDLLWMAGSISRPVLRAEDPKPAMMRLKCCNAGLRNDCGGWTLDGSLAGITVGGRTFLPGELDIARWLKPSDRADA
ncbi:MAG: hypothetical protein PHC98_05890 [Syntrophotalea acetylenica]|nr:hypothetical protein [Syntrophotalea acetylenica]